MNEFVKKEKPDFNKALIRPSENKSMFDQAARRYDLMNKIISLGMDGYWRSRAIALLNVKNSGFYIDAGCGTADILIDMARKHSKQAMQLTGVDQSAGMLAVGQKKLEKLGLNGKIHLQEGDALKLPFPDQSADGIINAFVFRNLDDRMAALNEWRRVLKPGGRCVILELSRPDNPFLLAGYHLYTRLFVPLAAALFSRIQDYQYLINSIASFPPQNIILDMMTSAGFSQVKAYSLSGGVVRIYTGSK